jgi:uncharacterized protein
MNVVAVFDTNILISGVFWSGPSMRALLLARQGHVSVIASRVLLFELRDVLTRDTKPFRLSNQEADRVLAELVKFITIVEPKRTIKVCRDANDNHVLEVAASGGAQYIVTGDPDLLVLRRFEDIQIMNVATFLGHIENLPSAE